MLHIVNKSPSQTRTLASCLRLAQDGSAVLLIEDGVYAATRGNADAAASARRLRRVCRCMRCSPTATRAP